MRYEGVVCVLKPPGMSSSDAVTDVRRIFGERRVGHTGTLDPAAAGVLPICVGRATRLFDYLVDKQKEYIAQIRFGAATDTEDATGIVISSSNAVVSAERLQAVLPLFMGNIEQTPPMYSALNINGVKMYKLARRGDVSSPVESKKRTVTIFELELMRQTAENTFLLRIVCSKGTYIRTLCKDIGDAVGIPAYMALLLRTRSGAFRLEDSHSIAELAELKEQGRLECAVTPMDMAVSHLPELRLTGLSQRNRRLLVNGASIRVDDGRRGIPMRLYADSDFMGLCVVDKNGMVRISVWLGSDEHIDDGVMLEGNVRENRHIGTEIGFPTANIEDYDVRALPEDGVYATIAVVDGKSYRAVTSVGTNPTVGGKRTTVETYMMGFSGDCYGRRMSVRFIKKLRGMMRFSSKQELTEQIDRDVKTAKQLFETQNIPTNL